MPSEIRYINFTADEFQDAARLFFRRMGEKLSGTIDGLVIEDDCRIKLLLVRSDTGARYEMHLDHNKIGSILVFYCIEHGIPLPAKSIRTLKLFGGNICLMVTKNIPTAELDHIKLQIPD